MITKEAWYVEADSLDTQLAKLLTLAERDLISAEEFKHRMLQLLRRKGIQSAEPLLRLTNRGYVLYTAEWLQEWIPRWVEVAEIAQEVERVRRRNIREGNMVLNHNEVIREYFDENPQEPRITSQDVLRIGVSVAPGQDYLKHWVGESVHFCLLGRIEQTDIVGITHSVNQRIETAKRVWEYILYRERARAGEAV